MSLSPSLTEEELKLLGLGYLGENVTVYRNTILSNAQNITLDNGCEIDDFVFISATDSVTIGKRVHIAPFVSIAGGGEVIIGDYAGLSTGTIVYSGTDDFLGGGLTGPTIPKEFRAVERGFALIGKFCVLGAGTIVLPNVTIGEGTVTGAGTVVTKDLDSWGVYVGTPAKKIKDRPKDKILKLEQEMIDKYGY